MQRVQVLASGKYKFVKNKGTARASTSRKRTPSRKRARTTTTRRKPTMARRKKTRAKRKMTVPVGLLIPGAIGTYAYGKEVWGAVKARNYRAAMDRSVQYSVGFRPSTGTFDVGDAYLALGWGTGMVVHKGAQVIGINKALGAARVPYVRV